MIIPRLLLRKKSNPTRDGVFYAPVRDSRGKPLKKKPATSVPNFNYHFVSFLVPKTINQRFIFIFFHYLRLLSGVISDRDNSG